MKRLLTSIIFVLIFCLNSSPKETITIDVNQLSNKVLNISNNNNGIVKAELDVTNMVAFMNEWKTHEERKIELINLYFETIPAVFEKYNKAKEFHLYTYVNHKNRVFEKKEVVYLSKLVITKKDFLDCSWEDLKNNFKKKMTLPSYKHFKVFKFSNV